MVPEFSSEILISIARYVAKTMEMVVKFLRNVPELTPILNKAGKKGDDELKKKTVAMTKVFIACFKETMETATKILNHIQDFLENVHDLCSENKWGKRIREIVKVSKSINEEMTQKSESLGFKIESSEKMVIWTIMNERSMFSALNVSNSKELLKTLKNIKI